MSHAYRQVRQTKNIIMAEIYACEKAGHRVLCSEHLSAMEGALDAQLEQLLAAEEAPKDLPVYRDKLVPHTFEPNRHNGVCAHGDCARADFDPIHHQ